MCQPVGILVGFNQCNGTSITSGHSNPQQHTGTTESIPIIIVVVNVVVVVIIIILFETVFM